MELDEILRFSNRKHWKRICFLSEIDANNRYYRTFVRLDANLCDIIDELDDIELTLWLDNNICKVSAVRTVFEKGRYIVFYKAFRFDVLYYAAEYGKFEMLKWAIGKVGISERVVYSVIFRSVVKGGHLDICKWLVETLKLTKTEVTDEDSHTIQVAAEYGRLDILQWIEETFGLDRTHITAADYGAFRYAAEKGHLEVCQWIAKKYRFVKRDVTTFNNYTFQLAVKHGRLKVLMWLTETFEINRLDAMRDHGLAIRWATVESSNLDVLKWIIRHFDLDKNTVIASLNYQYWITCTGASDEAREWLYDTYEI